MHLAVIAPLEFFFKKNKKYFLLLFGIIKVELWKYAKRGFHFNLIHL